MLGQKLLEAVFGDQAVRRLAENARRDLNVRVRALMDDEKRRFIDQLDKLEISTEAPEQLRGAWAFDHAFYVILNLAVGGGFDGDPASEAIFPGAMLVDYVRVYARYARWAGE